MGIFSKLADLYISGSVHVAIACSTLTMMTQHMFGLQKDPYVVLFAFFGTIVGYNFVKYDALARSKSAAPSLRVREFAILSGIAFIGAAWSFLNLQLTTQLSCFAFLAITVLYTLPFFPTRKNARNWAGVKIYMVALCWVGVTVLLPLLEQWDAETITGLSVLLKCVQRFILVFVLVLIFEIVDLQYDDPHLKTVPQQIGVRKTKILGLLLMLIFVGVEFLKTDVHLREVLVDLVLLGMVSVFLLSAHGRRPRFYTAFWVESIPIIWWLMVSAFF